MSIPHKSSLAQNNLLSDDKNINNRPELEARDNEPIIALCTSRGRDGALALIRLVGTGVRSLVNSRARLSGSHSLTTVATHTISYGQVVDHDDQTVDQVLFMVMDAPRTFTGQDTVEITCHNNPFIIEHIINLYIKQGARPAQAGEFTKRAFLSGKVDLVQAEAINELIHAQTHQGLKTSLAQLEGSLSQWVTQLEQELMKTLAWCEASFEFLDEEHDFKQQIYAHLTKIQHDLQELKRNKQQQQYLRQGVRIALLGSVNAGKSSLFNLLLQEQRAIVTPHAGTTRDAIEATISRHGTFLTLIDTAGIRHTDDTIEQEGIKRSYQEAEKADIILLIVDGSQELTAHEEEIYQDLYTRYSLKTILVHHKADLPVSTHNTVVLHASLTVASGQQPHGKEELERVLEEKVAELFAQNSCPFLLNQRHFSLLETIEIKLDQPRLLCEQERVPYELVSYHIKDALETLSELTGRSISEAGIERVFKEFCVGK